ncbi:MAG: terpene cyclase/mutase family protein [Anaerolineales bacterium]|nr:terpene cyclase/mutase family protein [Anaerolineales bacterium]
MDLWKAVEFVRSVGNEIEQARLKYLLANERPAQQLVARLFADQRPDGGLPPFWAKDYSSLDATCFRLAQAEQMGLGESEAVVMRAAAFLAQRQSPDGSWEEDEKVASLAPVWAKPGDLSARLYLTANCGLWLALLDPSCQGVSRAAHFLQLYLDLGGCLPSFMHAHWLAGGLWHRLNRQELAERVFAYLTSRVDDLAVSNLSWLITTVRAAGVAPSHPLVDKAASLLEQSQENDGRWPSEDGSTHDVHSTLEALRALWLCGRVMKLGGAG